MSNGVPRFRWQFLSWMSVFCLGVVPAVFAQSGIPSYKPDLNPPDTLNPKVGDSNKKTVLIYYANETAPNTAEAENYAKVIEWLESTYDSRLKKLAESLRNDLKTFQATVDLELASIKRNIVTQGEARGVAVAVFTNRLARQSEFQVYEQGNETVTTHKLKLPEFKHMTDFANPLSLANVFRLALEAVTREFDPEDYQFVLITKSHGSSDLVMMPRMAVDVSNLERDTFLAQLKQYYDMREQRKPSTRQRVSTSQSERAGNEELSKIERAKETGNPLEGAKDTDNPLEGTKETDNPLASEDFKTLMPVLSAQDELNESGTQPLTGVTKEQYLETLAEMTANKRMQFPLVFLESCNSELGEARINAFRNDDSQIGVMYTSDLTGLQYVTLDYNQVFELAKSTSSFPEAVQLALFTKYQEQQSTKGNADKSSPDN